MVKSLLCTEKLDHENTRKYTDRSLSRRNIQKNNLKLSHEFYHTFGNKFFNQLELDGLNIIKYLHGEELETDNPNGIYSVNYLGVPLGGGKAVQGKLKNYYKKELRI